MLFLLGDRLGGRSLQVVLNMRSHGSGRSAVFGRRPRVVGGNVNVRRGLRVFALGLKEARLQVNDVVTQLIILCLHLFETFIEDVELSNLILQRLDMSFLALSESPL